jgi:hypothetical protein
VGDAEVVEETVEEDDELAVEDPRELDGEVEPSVELVVFPNGTELEDGDEAEEVWLLLQRP